MPTLDWLRREFNYGYDSGDVLAWFPNGVRRKEQASAGGSYRRVFNAAALPHLRPDQVVMELGPGRGSWSRALLRYLPEGQLHTFDFQDVTPWLQPERYAGRLICHHISDNAFADVADSSFDFGWSFGVLCHNNTAQIELVLRNLLPKFKPGALAVHQYGDWQKLERYGWERGCVPREFRDKPDDEIWWPRNDQATMRRVVENAGWKVLNADLGLLQRDSIMLMQRP